MNMNRRICRCKHSRARCRHFISSSDGEVTVNERHEPFIREFSSLIFVLNERLEEHPIIRNLHTRGHTRGGQYFNSSLPIEIRSEWSEVERRAHRFLLKKYGQSFLMEFFGNGQQDSYITTTEQVENNQVECFKGDPRERYKRIVKDLNMFNLEEQCRQISSTT